MTSWPRLLITGGAGRLGRALTLAAAARGAPVWALSRTDLDVTQPDAIARMFAALKPEIVINAAARTAVDQCEAEPTLTFAVNAEGAEAVARGCEAIGARCIHISTDYVFGDHAEAPLREDTATDPINVYGASKAEAERRVLGASASAMVVRTAWLFGDTPDDFIGRLLAHGRDRATIDVVDDQFGSPTPILGAAERLMMIAERLHDGAHMPAVLHLAGTPPTTRADWADAVFAAAAAHGARWPTVHRVKTSAYPTPARRPLRTALNTQVLDSLLGRPLEWRAATSAAVSARLAPADASSAQHT